VSPQQHKAQAIAIRFVIMLMQECNCEVALPLIELLVHATAVTVSMNMSMFLSHLHTI